MTTDKYIEALKLAMEVLEDYVEEYGPHEQDSGAAYAITAIREALAEQPAEQQEPVTVLPDGSAFAVMSYPLPKDHWLYADRQYNDGEYEPVELGKPVLTHELRDAVVSAVRYAIRGATNCGKEVDFDPDALVKNAVYALCGPFTLPQPAQQQEPVAVYVGETWCGSVVRLYEDLPLETPLYTSPPIEATTLASPSQGDTKPWQGLTDAEFQWIYDNGRTPAGMIEMAEAKLREKNEHREKNA